VADHRHGRCCPGWPGLDLGVLASGARYAGLRPTVADVYSDLDQDAGCDPDADRDSIPDSNRDLDLQRDGNADSKRHGQPDCFAFRHAQADFHLDSDTCCGC
jgi:hypothetical protein